MPLRVHAIEARDPFSLSRSLVINRSDRQIRSRDLLHHLHCRRGTLGVVGARNANALVDDNDNNDNDDDNNNNEMHQIC